MVDQQDPRPIPNDPTRELVQSMLDIEGEVWWLTAEGDYTTSAVETMSHEGADWQRVIALEWPARRNHGKEHRILRMMISPEDALGLAEVLIHTAQWLAAASAIEKTRFDE